MMFTETIKSKRLNEIRYVCIISMVGDSHLEVLLEKRCS